MDKLFLTVLNMSITGAYVIAAICIARLFLKKSPKIITYCLWTVAAFRLIFPFSIESILSLIPFNAQPIPTDIAIQPVPRIDSGIAFVNSAVSGVLPAATPEYSANPLQIWTAIGAYAWIIGVGIMVIYGISSYILLKRKMHGAVHADGNIYEADNIKSPFVLGVFKPKIYLPLGLSEKEREYILLHEQTHIRRRDHIVKFGAYFILCLHWFNPLAWAAFILMGVDMEMSCDERVLKEIGGDTKHDYSRSLLSLATERRVIGGSPLAFGEGGVKGRIKNVLNFRKPSRIIIISAIALAAVLSVGFALNRGTEVAQQNGGILYKEMTLDEVRALAAKGGSLQYSDFPFLRPSLLSSYSGGYNPTLYGVEGGYRLLINFNDTLNPESGIRSTALESIWESGGSGIDIRYNDVDEFIRANPSSPALTVLEARNIAKTHLSRAVTYLDTDWWEDADEFLHHSKDPVKQALSESLDTIVESTYQFTDDNETYIAVGKRYGTIYEYNNGAWNNITQTTPIAAVNGGKPFMDMKAADITAVNLYCVPPGVSLDFTDYETINKIVTALNDVVTYEQDDSGWEYVGQLVLYTLTTNGGGTITVGAYNPFIIINGQYYRTKYEPCEELNALGNSLKNSRN